MHISETKRPFALKKDVIRNLYGNAPVSETDFSRCHLQFQNVALPDTLCIEAHVKLGENKNVGCFLYRRRKTHNSNFLRKRVEMRNLYGNAPVSKRGFSQYTLQF